MKLRYLMLTMLTLWTYVSCNMEMFEPGFEDDIEQIIVIDPETNIIDDEIKPEPEKTDEYLEYVDREIESGTLTTYTLGEVDFYMVDVEKKIFYEDRTVLDDYLIGETEITYNLWSTVRNWALENGYELPNPGTYTGPDDNQIEDYPVSNIMFRDIIVWCNALTEYYNELNGEQLQCFYYSDTGFKNPVRTSSSSYSYNLEEGGCDNPYIKENADGFRLPSDNEWLLAAAYIGDENSDGDLLDDGESLPGYFLSGAEAACDDDVASGTVGVIQINSDNVAAPVKSREPNHLGIYDMSGNVEEIIFNSDNPESSWTSSNGGSFYSSTYYATITSSEDFDKTDPYGYIGFRIVKNAKRAVDIPITNLTLIGGSTVLKKGDTEQLLVVIEPDLATNKTLLWSSSDSSIVSVSDSGLLTGVSSGEVEISVMSADGEVTSSCTVHAEVDVTCISLNYESLFVEIGDVYPLEATVYPYDATNSEYYWTSDSEDVATVNGLGEVEVVGDGCVNISATTVDGSFTATTTLIVDDVYMAGYSHHNYTLDVKQWINGDEEILSSSGNGHGLTIYVDNSDIYVGGREVTDGTYVAKYWKNGAGVELTDGTQNALINDIYVDESGNVYAAGYESNGTVAVAKYWINGEVYVLGDGENSSELLSLYRSGTDLYVAGHIRFQDVSKLVCWKNNTVYYSEEFGYDSQINDIYVDGENVYLTGVVNNQATYWENGEIHTLTDAIYSQATSIMVSNGDVYVTGGVYLDENFIAVLWKNGDMEVLSNEYRTFAKSLFIVESDIYVGGYIWSRSGDKRVVVWVNGNPVYLTDGSIDEYGWGIYVKR